MSIIWDLIQKSAQTKNRRLFIATLCYYCLLFFCNSNILLLVFSFIYFIFLWKLFKSASLAALICFFVHLPFVKGKSFSFMVLPKEMVKMYIHRDIIYYFPLTVSDFYLGFYFWLQVRNKKVRYTRPVPYIILACLLLFFLFNVLSAAFSDNLLVSFLSCVILLKFIVIFLLPGFVEKGMGLVKKIIYLAASFTVFESLWGCVQYILRGNLGRYIESYNSAYTYGKVAWENSNLLRASGTFVDPDLFGTFGIMHFVLFFFLFLHSARSTKFEKTLYGACAVLSGISVFITGNRALYICFAVALAAILLMTKKVRYSISLIRKPAGIAVIVAAIIFLFPYVSTRMQNLSAIFSQGSGTFRIQIAQYAARLGFANIFGVGLGMSPYHFALNFPGEKVIFGPDYPHTIFFQIFAETGILGLIAFIGFIYLSLRPLILGRKTAHTYFYLAATAYLVSACFYPLYIPLVELPSFFFLYLGLAVFSNL
jgi:hypothetical protein